MRSSRKDAAVYATRTIAFVLSLIAPLFSYLDEKEYGDLSESGAWGDVRALAAKLACDSREADRFARACALPSWPERSSMQDELLVAGLPYAVLPVESLYKAWSSQEGNAFGATRGLYLGDPARHLNDVYRELSLEVPASFASMPDHLTLELELLSIVLEVGNAHVARQLVSDHFDWLGSYDEALERHAAAIAANGALLDPRRTQLVEGVKQLRSLLALTERLVREVEALEAHDAPEPESALAV